MGMHPSPKPVRQLARARDRSVDDVDLSDAAVAHGLDYGPARTAGAENHGPLGPFPA